MFNKDTHPLNKLKFLDDKAQWQNEAIQITDRDLTIAGHPVMERWEAPYMKKLAEIASANKGRVLEVGFGLGISSQFIQENGIAEHHIIEANKFVYETLLSFAESAKAQVFPYFGFWEDISGGFPDAYFDGILFDTYPIVEKELHDARFAFFREAHRLLGPGGIFTHYSGEVEFTPEYVSYISNAGFTGWEGELIDIHPPENCQYWDETKILAPKFIKV